MLSGTLTVKENIHLSAALRLPNDMDRREREEKVDEVVEELGLSHVASTMVPTYVFVLNAYVKKTPMYSIYEN